MKIVFVSKECPPSPRSAGIGSYVWETGRALSRMGHTVTIIAAADNGELQIVEPSAGLRVIRLPDDEMGVETRNIVFRTFHAPESPGIAYRKRVAHCLRDLLDRDQVDLIEFPGFRGESVAWLQDRQQIPIVVRMHGFTAGIDSVWKDKVSASRRLKTKWEVRELRSANCLTAVSEDQARAVRRHFGDIQIRVVHNGIDTARWRELSMSAPRKLDKTDILFAGTLVAKKGIFVLLQAAEQLRERGWRGRLVLAGRPTAEFHRFLRIRATLGMKLPSWIKLLGMCSREQLAGFYRDAGVCCFPSLLEPLGYTCLEALACGGIVMGSDNTGIAEILTRRSGFLVPPGNADALAAGLWTAITMSEEERREMREAAFHRVAENFDHRVVTPRLIGVYEEAIHQDLRGQQC